MRIAQYSFVPPHTPSFFQSSSSPMIGLCGSVGWSLATGLIVEEPEHCYCGERHGFKEVRMCRYMYQRIHTTLSQVNSYAARRAAPRHFTPAPTSGTASPPPHKRCTFQSINPLPTKPPAPSKLIIPIKHLFIPNKIHTFAADYCIKSGNVCPPTGQLS